MKNAEELFEGVLRVKIEENPKVLAGHGLAGKSICLDLTGPRGGCWSFFFSADESLEMKSGEHPSDCHIEMKDDTFEGVVRGTVNVPVAFMMRKIKVKGEKALAARVGLALKELFS